MKAHSAVETESGIVHSMGTTAANFDDVTQAGTLFQGQDIVHLTDAS